MDGFYDSEIPDNTSKYNIADSFYKIICLFGTVILENKFRYVIVLCYEYRLDCPLFILHIEI